MWERIWDFCNSPLGVTILAGVILSLLNRVYAAKPAWKKYEGTIIAAVKYAEKTIPDTEANVSFRRLDAAMKYVLGVYEALEHRRASEQVEQSLREGVEIVHAQLEATDTL